MIEAGVRDVRDLTDMGFPVWSKTVCAQGTVEEELGSVNVPIVCAGQMIQAGDVIMGSDVACVARRVDAQAVLAAARKQMDAEEAGRQRLAAGELGLDICDRRARLAEKGLEYV